MKRAFTNITLRDLSLLNYKAIKQRDILLVFSQYHYWKFSMPYNEKWRPYIDFEGGSKILWSPQIWRVLKSTESSLSFVQLFFEFEERFVVAHWFNPPFWKAVLITHHQLSFLKSFIDGFWRSRRGVTPRVYMASHDTCFHWDPLRK